MRDDTADIGSHPRSRMPSAALTSALAQNASTEDRGDQDIAASVDAMRSEGLLKAALPVSLGGEALGRGGETSKRSVRCLMEIARANLSAARLFEGHLNAVQLVAGFGTPEVRRSMAADVSGGVLLGVWGADGDVPVGLDPQTRRLTGAKRFASGLGLVAQAVVTVDTGPQVRLCLAETDEVARQDHGAWSMSGMRASVSGSYDFNNLAAGQFRMFGDPGDYLREPGFVSGVWRIAALQLGGTFGLLEAARRHLRQLERLDADAQVTRLSGILQRALAAVGLVERAAHVSDGPEGRADPDRAVALSIFARLETEEIGQDAIATVERAIGLSHFDQASETGRIARDLATYMRQVARDAFQQRAGRIALCRTDDLLALWHG